MSRLENPQKLKLMVAYVGDLRLPAENLASRLDLPIMDSHQEHPADIDAQLILNPSDHGYRLELNLIAADYGNIFVDFGKGAIAYRRRHNNSRRQPLAKAVGIKGSKPITIIDATAGLGRDAFVLSTMGCRLRLIERSVIIGALLENGIENARSNNNNFALFKDNMQLSIGDAQHLIPTLCQTHSADVIFLDPMYPHRSKSALVKKEMRTLRCLVGDDADAGKLLAVALQHAVNRVVVKRPRTAPTLKGPAPTHHIQSKNTRYDVYMSNAG